jgi:hypothetical protein
MTAPRRRWSFSLKMIFVAMFLLAIPLGWAAYSLHWIRQRHRLMGKYFAEMEIETSPGLAPAPLRLFESWGMETFPVPASATDDEIAEVKRWFPETTVVRQ